MGKGITDFGGLVASAGVPVMGPGLDFSHPDVLGIVPFDTETYFVQSTHASAADAAPAHGKSPKRPFSTIDYAVGQCTAGEGNLIVVGPKHVETVSAAAGLVFDVTDVTVYGLGCGNSRPQISVGTAVGADVDITADAVRLVNLRFTGDVDNITALLDLDGADDVVLYAIEIQDVTGQVAIGIDAKDCDDLHIIGLVYRGASAAGTTVGLRIENCDRLVLSGFRVDGNFSTGFLQCVTVASLDIEVGSGIFRTRNAADIFAVDTVTGSTGAFYAPIYIRLQDNAANVTEAITGATFWVYAATEIGVVNAANEAAVLLNWVESTDA